MNDRDFLHCDSCSARHRVTCSDLSRDEIGRLNAIAHHKTLPPGRIIFNDCDVPSYFANIITGVVKLTKTLGDGRQQIVGLQFASDFLGRPYRKYSTFSAQTVTEVQLCTYEKAQFERLIGDMQGFQHRLYAHVLNELDAAQEWMLLLGRKSAMEKVASFLSMIANRSETADCRREMHGDTLVLELPLTRSEIADFLGLTLETVSRQFSRLKAAKIIELEGNNRIVRIRNKGWLASASEQSASARTTLWHAGEAREVAAANVFQ